MLNLGDAFGYLPDDGRSLWEVAVDVAKAKGLCTWCNNWHELIVDGQRIPCPACSATVTPPRGNG